MIFLVTWLARVIIFLVSRPSACALALSAIFFGILVILPLFACLVLLSPPRSASLSPRKHGILGLLGIAPPPSVSLLLVTKDHIAPLPVYFDVAHRFRGSLRISPRFGTSPKDFLEDKKSIRAIRAEVETGVFSLFVRFGSKQTSVSIDGTGTVGDLLERLGYGRLVSNNLVYASYASRTVPNDCQLGSLSRDTTLALNLRLVGGAKKTPVKKGRKAGTVSQANPLSKAYRYDPRAWPQEAQDLIRPLISPTVPLTETQIGDFIEALVDDWRARQPDEFWDEMELLAEVQKHTRRDAKDNRIKVELRKYVGREVADITQVGPPGYLSSKIKTIRWLLQMSLSRPYLIRKRYGTQFGIPVSTYTAAGDESDGDPDDGGVLVRGAAMKKSLTKLVLLDRKNGGSGEPFRFFDPMQWPSYAIDSFRPLVVSGLPWDEDRARGSLGDLIHAILRYQTPGFLQDLETAGSGARTDLVWQRLAQVLEEVVGYAGNRATRPNSFSSVVRWIERVYKDGSRGTVKSKYHAQFLPPPPHDHHSGSLASGPATVPSAQPTVSLLGQLTIATDSIRLDSLPTDQQDTSDVSIDPVAKVELEDVVHDPVCEDTEIILDRMLVSAWKLEKEKAREEARAIRPPNTPATFCTWRPRLFRSIPLSTREENMAIIRSRCYTTAWNNVQSFTTDRDAIIRSLDEFTNRIILPKTDTQLSLIQRLPDIQVSPAVLKATGLSLQVASGESAIIYVKFHKGDRGSLDILSTAVRPATRAFATRIAKFLGEPVPAHLLDLDIDLIDRSGSMIHFSHVGRFSAGLANRQFWEHREGRYYRPEKGGRVWADSMYACGSDGSDMQYHVLADHSEKVGDAWAHAMRWDELWFCVLLLGPALTNVSWPGLAVPEPPSRPGETLTAQTSTAAWVARASLAKAANKFGCEMDDVTLSCLDFLGWTGKSHPVDWVVVNKRANGDTTGRGPTALRFVLVSSLGDTFPIKWDRSKVGKQLNKDSVQIRARLFVYRSISRAHLQIRPAGTVDMGAGYEAPERRMTYNSLAPGSAAQRSLLYGHAQSSGFINVSLALHPTYICGVEHPAMTLIFNGCPLRSGEYSAYSGSTLVLELQREATMLLLGKPVPSQAMTDLAIYPSTIRKRLARLSKGTAIDSSVTEGEDDDLEVSEEESAGPVAGEVIGSSSSAGPSGATKLPPTMDMRDAWDSLMVDEKRTKAERWATLIVGPDEVVDANTSNLTARGFHAAHDRRTVVLHAIRDFRLAHQQRYDLYDLPEFEKFDVE